MPAKHKMQKMKNKKHALTLSNPPRLSEVIHHFLASKAPQSRHAYLATLGYTLGSLTRVLGNPPVSAVTTRQLCQSVLGSRLTLRSKKQRLAVIKTFFSWSRANGYLPPHYPTPADPIRVVVPSIPPVILTPPKLKKLLAGTKDVEVLLAIALSAFSGLRHDDLISLRWGEIIPARLILVQQFRLQERVVTPVGHWVPIPPALDAWLRPFYGSQGLVLAESVLETRLPALAATLGIELWTCAPRYSYGAYRYALTGSVETTAMELGLSFRDVRDDYPHIPPEAEARQYFSLIPEAVGLRGWPALVANHRSRRQALRNRKLALLPALLPSATSPAENFQNNHAKGPTYE